MCCQCLEGTFKYNVTSCKGKGAGGGGGVLASVKSVKKYTFTLLFGKKIIA